jgi:hypothetical protein
VFLIAILLVQMLQRCIVECCVRTCTILLGHARCVLGDAPELLGKGQTAQEGNLGPARTEGLSSASSGVESMDRVSLQGRRCILS